MAPRGCESEKPDRRRDQPYVWECAKDATRVWRWRRQYCATRQAIVRRARMRGTIVTLPAMLAGELRASIIRSFAGQLHPAYTK